MSNLSITSIIKSIFWISFFAMFASHGIFRFHFFDIREGGLGSKIYWFVEVLLYITALKLISSKKYSLFFLKPNLFLFSLFIIFVSIVINFQSLVYSLLSLRIFYPFFLLAYIIYIYNFQKKTYRYFFKLFLSLAIINSILSILQFIFMDFLGLTEQLTGGIFGFHGTGIGAIFSVVQSALFLQIYLHMKKPKYLVYAIFVAVPIVTGYAYGGFIFLVFALIIVSISYSGNFNLSRIFTTLVIGIIIIFSAYTLAKNIQIEKASKGYFNTLTNIDAFKKHTIEGNTQDSEGRGRIGYLIFAFEEMTDNFQAFVIGHGPGSISYQGLSTGIKNLSGTNINGSSLPLMSYMYELGIWGILILIITFYFLFRKWKKTMRPKEGIEMYYFDNIPVLLAVYLSALTYTIVLSNYFLVIFFAFNVSYLNHLHNAQTKSNYNISQLKSINQ
jgi:hypothetical protein